jgi:excisionase family DNA binding protein
MENLLLRVAEAASLINVSRWTIYRWIEEGRLEATKLGKGSLRVFSASLASLVEKNRTEPYRCRGGREGGHPWGKRLSRQTQGDQVP